SRITPNARSPSMNYRSASSPRPARVGAPYASTSASCATRSLLTSSEPSPVGIGSARREFPPRRLPLPSTGRPCCHVGRGRLRRRTRPPPRDGRREHRGRSESAEGHARSGVRACQPAGPPAPRPDRHSRRTRHRGHHRLGLVGVARTTLAPPHQRNDPTFLPP